MDSLGRSALGCQASVVTRQEASMQLDGLLLLSKLQNGPVSTQIKEVFCILNLLILFKKLIERQFPGRKVVQKELHLEIEVRNNQMKPAAFFELQ